MSVENKIATHPVFLPGKSYGQRSLTGYSPWGYKRVILDLVTKQQLFIEQLMCVSGRGNSNPFQYSCLENPMDRGAWWATVPGVTRVTEH